MEALVVAGAGLHGPFQCGVLETRIKRDGYKPDIMVGCSVGATTVCALSHLGFDAKGIDTLKELWFGLKNIQSIFGRNWTFPIWSNGYYNGEPLKKLIGSAIEGKESTIPFEVAVCDLDYGETAYFGRPAADPGCVLSSLDSQSLPLLEAVEGSYSIPLAVELLRDRYCDGGVIDCAPVMRALELGATSIQLILGYTLEMPAWATKSRGVKSVAERLIDVCTTQLLLDDVNAARLRIGDKLRIDYPKESLGIGMLEVDPQKIRDVWAAGTRAV